jgi:hypothetical protein
LCATADNPAHCTCDPAAVAADHSDPVILDELGYLPFSASGGALLFHLLSKFYERTNKRSFRTTMPNWFDGRQAELGHPQIQRHVWVLTP